MLIILGNMAVEWFKFKEYDFSCLLLIILISTQLAYCIVQFLEKDPGLTEPVRIAIQGNPTLWPPRKYSHLVIMATLFLPKEKLSL